MAHGVKFNGSNHVYRPPEGVSEDQCRSLHVFKNGVCIVSAWEFTDDELSEIIATRRAFLSVWGGDRLNPVYVGSETTTREVVVDFGPVWPAPPPLPPLSAVAWRWRWKENEHWKVAEVVPDWLDRNFIEVQPLIPAQRQPEPAPEKLRCEMCADSKWKDACPECDGTGYYTPDTQQPAHCTALADALEKSDWSNTSIGNKALIVNAIATLRNITDRPVQTAIEALSPQERVNLIEGMKNTFCFDCGKLDPNCKCGNDE